MAQPQHSPHPRTIVPQLASARKAPVPSSCAASRAVDSGGSGSPSPSAHLFEAAANLVAYLLAEFLPSRRSFLFGDVEPIEDVKIFDNRVTSARHGEDAQQFGCRPAGPADFPSANGIGAARREAAKLRHIGGGQRSADRIAEILA